MKLINDRRRMRGQGGFTLIELLVVIAILGVLAGVTVFAVSGITDQGDVSACKIDKRTIQTAVEAYRAEKNTYPQPANGTVNSVATTDGLQTVRAAGFLDASSVSKYWKYDATIVTGPAVDPDGPGPLTNSYENTSYAHGAEWVTGC